MKYIIDGLFLTQQITGIQRYAYEIISELDKICKKNEFIILVPKKCDIKLKTENIDIVKFGNFNGILWQQIDLPLFAVKNRSNVLCLTNILPLVYPKGVVVIHDISYKVNPRFFTSKRDRLSALWHRINYFRAVHSKMKIVTVSEFSKSELMKYYKVEKSKIDVIYNSWEHINRIDYANDTFEKFSFLKNNDYYFSMCTLAPNKNINWIIKYALNHPDEKFAVAGGGKLKETILINYPDLKNVYFLGYVSDEDAKTLMRECKAFVFPTLYEGFGIPPLEAIGSGVKSVFVSDTPCMREIYKNKVNFIDLFCEKYDLHNNVSAEITKELLNDYSWRMSAYKFYELLNR